MILASKTGWLIAVQLISHTDTHWVVKAYDEKRERKVLKTSNAEKCFTKVSDAENWIRGGKV